MTAFTLIVKKSKDVCTTINGKLGRETEKAQQFVCKRGDVFWLPKSAITLDISKFGASAELKKWFTPTGNTKTIIERNSGDAIISNGQVYQL